MLSIFFVANDKLLTSLEKYYYNHLSETTYGKVYLFYRTLKSLKFAEYGAFTVYRFCHEGLSLDPRASPDHVFFSEKNNLHRTSLEFIIHRGRLCFIEFHNIKLCFFAIFRTDMAR